MITKQLPSRKHIWSTQFLKAVQLAKHTRDEELLRAEKERRSYAPKFQASSVVNFLDCEKDIDPIAYNDSTLGPRSSVCSVCNKMLLDTSAKYVCDLCPSVVHRDCAISQSETPCLERHYRHFSLSYKRRIQLHEQEGAKLWTCYYCSREISLAVDQEQQRLKQDRFKRVTFFAAVKLQSALMRYKAVKNYQIVYKAVLQLQAQCRGYITRKGFRSELKSTHRVFRIKCCSFDLENFVTLAEAQNMSCIICILNNSSEDLDDDQKQIYRFDTHVCSSGKLNESFLVYSNCNIIISVTLHSKDFAVGMHRPVFFGQFIVNASSILERSFVTGNSKRLGGELKGLKVAPRDQRFSFTAPHSSSYGKVSFDLVPFSNIESKCGILEEILSAVLQGAKKKYFAVLAEKTLSLYSQYGDIKPKIVINLSFGSHVRWFDSAHKIIKITNLDNKCWLFSCSNPQQLNGWYNKLTGSYRNTLLNGSRMFKKNDQCS
jgi:hypothetical protein